MTDWLTFPQCKATEAPWHSFFKFPNLLLRFLPLHWDLYVAFPWRHLGHSNPSTPGHFNIQTTHTHTHTSSYTNTHTLYRAVNSEHVLNSNFIKSRLLNPYWLCGVLRVYHGNYLLYLLYKHTHIHKHKLADRLTEYSCIKIISQWNRKPCLDKKWTVPPHSFFKLTLFSQTWNVNSKNGVHVSFHTCLRTHAVGTLIHAFLNMIQECCCEITVRILENAVRDNGRKKAQPVPKKLKNITKDAWFCPHLLLPPFSWKGK